MSVIDQTDQSTARAATEMNLPGSPQAHRWTVYEYQQLFDLGLLGERKTELADGVIVEMSSQKDPHRIGVSRVARAVMGMFDESYLVTIQSTIRLSLHESREPDACVEMPPKNAGENALVHPLLVVEVSDETLLYDQVVKASRSRRPGLLDCQPEGTSNRSSPAAGSGSRAAIWMAVQPACDSPSSRLGVAAR